MTRRPPELMTTTLWDFASQQYGDESQGDQAYAGATPAWIVWNLLQRYTEPKDLVVDPMAGSGTTLDVARELGRRALGYDLYQRRPDVFRCDARKLPLEDAKADFVFVDPPYSTHLAYGDDPRDIGKLDAALPDYYQALDQVFGEIERVLRPGRCLAVYCCDSFRKGKPFCPIGFELFGLLRKRFEPVDVISVVRHNKKLERGNWHAAAADGNFFLRGFNYLLIGRKGAPLRRQTEPQRSKRVGGRHRDRKRPRCVGGDR
ncbi:MAG: DNA methylase [Deltaproteobacteria bacterium]|nr:DNA methylase [Deltaproteobacteria bacterium]